MSQARCPYCGNYISKYDKYCFTCIAEGYNHVHEETGYTNGWDRAERKPRQHIPSGWRGRPVLGGGATSKNIEVSLTPLYPKRKRGESND